MKKSLIRKVVGLAKLSFHLTGQQMLFVPMSAGSNLRWSNQNPFRGYNNKRILSKDEKIYLAQREKLRIKLIEAEKYFCYRCGVSQKSLECHHIVWRSEIPRHEEKHNHRNLIFVCAECHAWYHDKKGNRNSLVEKRKLYKVFGEKVRNK